MTCDLDDSLLLVGKVLRPHGLRGHLKILAYAGANATFLHSRSLFLRQKAGTLHIFQLLSVKPTKSGFIIQLEDLSSLQDAEAYRDADLLVKKSTLPRKDEDEYYWYELLGLDVFLESGEYLGPVGDIIATGSNDIYVVKRGKHDILIPGTREIVRHIDLQQGKILIHPVEGLLDLYEI